MKKANYVSPSFDCQEFVLEEGIATSAVIDMMIIEEWEEGNTDWW